MIDEKALKIIMLAAIITILLIILVKPWEDTRLLSKGGSTTILRERGELTWSGNVISYTSHGESGTGFSRKELEALVTLSNDSTYIYISNK